MRMYGNKWLGYTHLYKSPFYTDSIKYNLRWLTLHYVPHEHKINKSNFCRICEFPMVDCPVPEGIIHLAETVKKYYGDYI